MPWELASPCSCHTGLIALLALLLQLAPAIAVSFGALPSCVGGAHIRDREGAPHGRPEQQHGAAHKEQQPSSR
jgi:hypothetical protein